MGNGLSRSPLQHAPAVYSPAHELVMRVLYQPGRRLELVKHVIDTSKYGFTCSMI